MLKKEEDNILKIHQKRLRNPTRNTMLPLQPDDVVTNLSQYQLNEDEIGLLKIGLEFSIPPMFLMKTNVFASLI